MPNKSKVKGSKFERDSVKDLSVNGGEWKRVPLSGGLGVVMGRSDFLGDTQGRYAWFSRGFLSQNKVGYGSSKSIRVQRTWITQNREEAKLDNRYPVLLLKFDDVRDDPASAKLICFNVDIFNLMMADIEKIYSHYLELLEKDFQSSKTLHNE